MRPGGGGANNKRPLSWGGTNGKDPKSQMRQTKNWASEKSHKKTDWTNKIAANV